MNEKVLKTLEFDKIVEQLMQYADTSCGRQLCEDCVPLDDIDKIEEAQSQTQAALSRICSQGSLSLSGAVDISPSLKRLEVGGCLSIPELLTVSSLLKATSRAHSYGHGETARLASGRYTGSREARQKRNSSGAVDSAEEDSARDCLTDCFNMLNPLSSLLAELDRCIKSEDELYDDASPRLAGIRRSIRSTQNQIHSQLNEFVNTNRSLLQDSVITMRNGRYCIPVKAEYKNQVNGMVHDQSQSGSTYFIEPMAVVKRNNEIRELEIAEKKEIEAILADLSSHVAEHADELRVDLSILSQLDYIFARADMARDMDAVRPVFREDGITDLHRARHPLLDRKSAVPVDICLGKDYNTLIITGPNTGGKTVTLKTAGLLTLMGQAGLHIPAAEGSQLALFREVYADIGDEQSIEQSLSTFSSHMTNIVQILERADSDSLVLLDELCAGTDPTEGAALAISILDFLHKLDVRVMATTHYSEIKMYALTEKGVENASCEFNVETLRPTYRLLIGIPGKSNAFAIAGRLGLPDFLIDDASSRIDTQNLRFEDMISELEASQSSLDQEREELEAEKSRLSELEEKLNSRSDDIDERRERILRDANEEARRILEDAKETADTAIRRVNRLADTNGSRRELEEQRRALRDKMTEVEDRSAARPAQKTQQEHKASDFHIGDAVHVLSLNLNGTVMSRPNSKGEVKVQMGILNSQVSIKDLELIDEQTITGSGMGTASPSKRQGVSGMSEIGTDKHLNISSEINLIGMTVDEAIPVLDKYLDDAVLARLPQVRIIHGRGTGALRSAVQRFLKQSPVISEFHSGAYGEGDQGVTIAVLKNGLT